MKTTRTLGRFLLLALVVTLALDASGQTVTQVAGGTRFSAFLKSDGSLWGMGYDSDGALGNEQVCVASNTFLHFTYYPAEIIASNVTKIAAGGGHLLFLKTDGSLWGVGENDSGELGDGITASVYSFSGTNQPQEIAEDVTAMAAGQSHSLFVKSDGSLWAMGLNSYGQLGDGTYNSTNFPEMILSSGVADVAAGSSHSLFLKTDSTLWGMGYENYGQLGIGPSVAGQYNSTNLPQYIDTNVVMITACGWDSLYIKSDSSLWGMGFDGYGDLGNGVPNVYISIPIEIETKGVTGIALGQNHSLFTMQDGSLWAMGNDTYGQLGDPSLENQVLSPEMIVSSKVIAVAAGDQHSLFIKSDGTLWAMGEGSYGELGNGTINDANVPIQVYPFAYPAGFNQNNVRLSTNNSVILSALGVPNVPYVLYQSQTLTNWTAVTNVRATATGILAFTNTIGPATGPTDIFWRYSLSSFVVP